MKRHQSIDQTLRLAAIIGGLGAGMLLTSLLLGLAEHREVLRSNLFFIGYMFMTVGITLAAVTVAGRGKR